MWVRLPLNVSGLGQTVRFLPNKVELFHLYAPGFLAEEPGTRKKPALGVLARPGSRGRHDDRLQQPRCEWSNYDFRNSEPEGDR